MSLGELFILKSALDSSSGVIGDIYGQKAAAAKGRAKAFTARSNASARAAYDDSVGTEFYEPWADQTNWSSATGQISAGRLYASAASATAASRNHSFQVLAGQKARVAASIQYKPGGAGGGLFIGLSSDAPGAVATGISTAVGLYMSANSISSYINGVATVIGNGTLTANVNASITIVIDALWISFVFTGDTTTQEYRYQIARSSFPNINNIYAMLNDGNYLTGSSIGPLAARRANSTVNQSYVIESKGRHVHWTQVGSNKVKIVTPAGYDCRVPTPAIVMFHGNGSDENLFSDNAGQQPAYAVLYNAGFIIISTAYSSGTSSWGNQNSLDAYLAAVEYARDNYNISSLVFYCNSMGGIEGQLCLADGRIPGVNAAIFHSTTHNLQDCYTGSGGAAIDFSATIKTAYGVASYAQIPIGHDPALMDPRSFRGLPMLILSADDDTSVNPVNNGKALAAKVTPWSPEVIVPAGITGGHSFSLTQAYTGNFNGAATYAALIAAFAKKYA